MKQITNPCLLCKKKPNCPKVCLPKRDYLRAVKKGRRKSCENSHP